MEKDDPIDPKHSVAPTPENTPIDPEYSEPTINQSITPQEILEEFGDVHVMEVEKKDVPESIKNAVNEAQLLINYIGNNGSMGFKKKNLETIITSKYLIDLGEWNSAAEIVFWEAYEELSTSIEPVTIESLKNNIPLQSGKERFKLKKRKKKVKTYASKAVSRYRLLTFTTLGVLLLLQVYWVVGSNLADNLSTLFEKRQIATLRINELLSSQSTDGTQIANRKIAISLLLEEQRLELKDLRSELSVLKQKLNGAYMLLSDWNRFWQILLFRDQFEEEVTEFDHDKYKRQKAILEKKQQQIEEKLNNSRRRYTKLEQQLNNVKEKKLRLSADHSLDAARQKMFLSRLAATYVLMALQSYFLPLLYGLLGASTYVLRAVAQDVKYLTYDYEAEIKYRLRLPLGALAGMIIGWFLTPDTPGFSDTISPMMLAFLTGYYVELLFSVMDSLSKKLVVKREKKTTVTHPTSK